MPRPNQPRSIASEDALARRIGFEREARGWSPQGLASRMTEAGCAIQASAIYKIEKADPPRRITVDELVAFSQVFEIPVGQLLIPPDIAAANELVDLVLKWDRAQDKQVEASRELDDAWDRLEKWVGTHVEQREMVEKAVRYWSETYFEGGHDLRVARTMMRLTGDAEWKKRAKAALDAEVER